MHLHWAFWIHKARRYHLAFNSRKKNVCASLSRATKAAGFAEDHPLTWELMDTMYNWAEERATPQTERRSFSGDATKRPGCLEAAASAYTAEHWKCKPIL